jgi:diguanylate cyclase (GGDEF)-like protein
MIPDVRTMWMVVATTTLLFGFLEVWAGLGKRRDTAMVLWGSANLAGGLGAGLLSTQGILPYVLSEAAANGLLVLFWGLIWAGIRTFAGQRVPWWTVAAGPLLVISACIYIPPLPADMAMRIFVTSIVIVGYQVLIAVDALRAERAEHLVMRRVLAAVALASAVPLMWRSVNAQLGGGPYDLMANTAASAIPLVALVTIAISMNICVLLVGRERLGNQLARAAVVDGLTGTLNRSGFLIEAQQAVHDSTQGPRPNSVVVMDLDEFKAVNDHYGHAAGDRLLVGFASVAQTTLRTEDVLGRIGGEEFCALLVGVGESEAVTIADRLRLAFAGAIFDFDDVTLTGTVSVGVAQLGVNEELGAAVQRADMAMYRAKKDGRDRVIRASE